MSKDPSYPWYPRDFAADEPVQLMSLEAEGAYRRLLDHQWLHGSIPKDFVQMAAICKRIRVSRMRKLWAEVMDCFSVKSDEPDRLQNLRLESVRVERELHRERRSDAGKVGAEARWRDRQPDASANATALPSDSLALALALASASSSEGKPSGDAGQKDSPEKPSDLATVMGAARTWLWPDGKHPEGRSGEVRDGSVAKGLLSRHPVSAVAEAVEGLRRLVDRGGLPPHRAGEPLRLRKLDSKHNGVVVFQLALDAYYANERSPPETPREHRGPTAIGDILNQGAA